MFQEIIIPETIKAPIKNGNSFTLVLKMPNNMKEKVFQKIGTHDNDNIFSVTEIFYDPNENELCRKSFGSTTTENGRIYPIIEQLLKTGYVLK
jgi:hypothetical protein